MVYYLQQNVAILDQISQQISSFAPQVSIPSTPPPPFPDFQPSASDIRINVFWFMALIFSLLTAFLAILVQQWVRDYMDVFQRYSDPLKSARLRQYLHEGCEGWYMPVVAESVPGLLHVSLFLFFVGLCDSVFNINTTVGISTTIPIGISGLLYIFMTFAPIIYPQSPYQNSFSGLVWYLIQKCGGRRYKDRGFDAPSKLVSSNMAEGQMQLAMEETEDRKGRDERAIRWLGSNMTEDAEMETFVMAIPGSFNGEWGLEVWKNVSNTTEDKNKSTSRDELSRVQGIFGSIFCPVGARTASDDFPNTPPLLAPHLPNFHSHSTTAHISGEETGHELTARVAHVLETCRNRNPFASDEVWRQRTRACVETTASLVFCAGAELGQFGDMAGLLGDIGSDQNVRESSTAGKDQSFVMRWTCLSLVAVRPILDSDQLRDYAQAALKWLETPVDDDTGEEQALTCVQKITETLNKASCCLNELGEALLWEENLTEDCAREVLRENESQILELERINIKDHVFQNVDSYILLAQREIDERSHGIITRQLPGVKFDDQSVHFSQFVEFFRDCHKFQIISPLQNLKRIRSVAHTFRNILEGQWDDDAFQEIFKNLQVLRMLPNRLVDTFRRQTWRLQDLRDGGGLGFTVELFFLAFKQLLSTSSSKALYVGTFRAITSDWSKFKHSLETHKLLLDMVMPYSGIISDLDYPDYIVDELLELLGKILEGQTGPHIDAVVQQVTDAIPRYSADYRARFVKVLDVITRARASSS